ncbi:Rieske 2Fe-2S domain-containing protein [Leptothoe sp. PORK10 BA2]|uniref:Rieske 2Fe-2S domain-containing protein n=1 Tax=Leptothoe sp. PORK10 BA2 TaxID=3110254 RepID=UPI002B1F27CF|nr:Rieske 2Fe-2S domain-containing protein [Leptothoe sp. PORK10 BA2]MEA5467093.1 Rieske 2Fe-2S domain-containing protein [Leptothoe sp. PORK10 BA2]
MSVAYKSIQWNRQKLVYDAILLTTVGLYLAIFMTVASKMGPGLDFKGISIRAYGSAAFILLNVILSIGPLTRLDKRFMPLLFNRRHMGVTMFFLALIHAIGLKLPALPYKVDGVLTWYHDFGNLKPWVSLFVGNTEYGDLSRFPFETLGAAALVIFLVMAATSHDFWLVNLTAPIWKALHMGVYLAYGLVVVHVILGPLETNQHPLLTVAVGVSLVWIVGLHLLTALREARLDNAPLGVPDQAGFIDVGSVSEIPADRAKIVTLAGERVAIFKYDGKLSAVSNVCQHQNGPLGEGKVVDGCITCPWHGYQYHPANGASPPPFTEKVPTFALKVVGDRIWVNSTPNPPGTYVEPAVVGA